MTKGAQSLLLLFLVGATVIALTLWRMGLMKAPDGEVPTVSVPSSPAQDAPVAQPQTNYPLDPSLVQSPLRAGQVGQALIDLMGREAVASFLQIDTFANRVAATVDNLGRSHAPGQLWPVHPTPGRLVVVEIEGGPALGADNAARYTPFVLLAESVNVAKAADLYARMYPLFQRAYEELGFPGRYFNDRVIEVIDLLIATPQVEYPVKLQLMEVKGPIASLRPWVRYEFADPALESLSSGQKILLRAGPENQRRLEAKLADFREELIKRSPRR